MVLIFIAISELKVREQQLLEEVNANITLKGTSSFLCLLCVTTCYANKLYIIIIIIVIIIIIIITSYSS